MIEERKEKKGGEKRREMKDILDRKPVGEGLLISLFSFYLVFPPFLVQRLENNVDSHPTFCD